MYDYSKIRFFFSVCNFLVHDKCLKSTTNPCVSVAATIVKVSWGLIVLLSFIKICRTERYFISLSQNPVAHCWTEEKSIKGKFCNVCRKKMHEVPGVRCEGQFSWPMIVSFNYSLSYLLFSKKSFKHCLCFQTVDDKRRIALS